MKIWRASRRMPSLSSSWPKMNKSRTQSSLTRLSLISSLLESLICPTMVKTKTSRVARMMIRVKTILSWRRTMRSSVSKPVT